MDRTWRLLDLSWLGRNLFELQIVRNLHERLSSLFDVMKPPNLCPCQVSILKCSISSIYSRLRTRSLIQYPPPWTSCKLCSLKPTFTHPQRGLAERAQLSRQRPNSSEVDAGGCYQTPYGHWSTSFCIG